MTNKEIIPPSYSKEEWNSLRHSDRIRALHTYSKSFHHSAQSLHNIKNEISYYQYVKSQIDLLTT